MGVLRSHFRLHSSAFKRTDEDEQNKIIPKKVIFLSVEGEVTEQQYFRYLGENLDKAVVHIEVLGHQKGDGLSDPKRVIDLLEEYVELREGEVIPEGLPKAFTDKYPKEFIKLYLIEPEKLPKDEKKAFRQELLKIGIDEEYRCYLQNFNGENDYFAVVFDRDCKSHSRKSMEECVKMCVAKKYGCYITNPCFEFWLLLHLRDVKTKYSQEELEVFLQNPKISKAHTAISNEISKLAGHTKNISKGIFDKKYFPNIKNAVERAESFASDFPDLFDKLGTNLPELMKILYLA